MSIASETPKAYLIVAYYNRQKWHKASPKQLEVAEKAAEDLFPDDNPKQLEDLASQGEFLPRSFASDLFGKVAGPYAARLAELKTALQGHITDSGAAARLSAIAEEQVVDAALSEVARDVRDQIVDSILASQPLETPVGWMVVVDANHFASYIDRMGGKGSEKGLWPVFDIEILPLDPGWTEQDVLSRVPPLRPDQTTKDVYIFMTPTNWNHRKAQ